MRSTKLKIKSIPTVKTISITLIVVVLKRRSAMRTGVFCLVDSLPRKELGYDSF